MNARRSCLSVVAAFHVSSSFACEREQIWFENHGRFVELIWQSQSLDVRKWCLMREQMDSLRRTGVDILQPSNGGLRKTPRCISDNHQWAVQDGFQRVR
jgi:hypothetical protein